MMFWRLCVILFVGALLEWKTVQCAPAEVGKPKGRAYEFGFTIEEQQHRHEKRDENGIVMGEFGFITADGIYHVTVYATDENGKFKILAMKSYPYASPEKKIMMMLPLPPKKPVVSQMIKKAIPLDTKSCGGCVLTKKLSPADVVEQVPNPDPESVFRPLSKTFNDVATKNVPSPIGSKSPLPPKLPSPPNAIGSTPTKGTPGSQINGKENPLTNFRQTGPTTAQVNRQSKAFTPSTTPQIDLRIGTRTNQLNNMNLPVGIAINQQSQKTPFNTNKPQQSTFTPQNTATAILQQNAKESTVFQPFGGSTQPSLSSKTQNTIQTQTKTPLLQQTERLPTPGTQSQINNNLTPTGIQQQNINGAKTPTTQSQSPTAAGKFMPSSQSSIGKTTPAGDGGGGPLYRFKYVLDYNSHREEGRIDGSKEGNYNTVDEDGIRRIIDYIANENGYQPHIKWERVPPNELPPTGENKLKEYEFVWFNRP